MRGAVTGKEEHSFSEQTGPLTGLMRGGAGSIRRLSPFHKEWDQAAAEIQAIDCEDHGVFS